MGVSNVFAMNIAVASIIGGLGRRVVGGLWLSWPLGLKRWVSGFVYAIVAASSLALSHASLACIGLMVTLLTIALALGQTAGFNWPGGSQTDGAMNMGRVSGPESPIIWSRFWYDFLIMAYHGTYQVALAALVFIGYHYYSTHSFTFPWLLLVAGIGCAPCYAIGWWLKPDFSALGMLNEPEKGLVDGAPAGEFLSGALRLALVTATFYRG